MDRDPRQSIGLVKMCTKTGINIPREYIQPYFIEKYENEKFVKNRKIQPHVPFKGTTAGDVYSCRRIDLSRTFVTDLRTFDYWCGTDKRRILNFSEKNTINIYLQIFAI